MCFRGVFDGTARSAAMKAHVLGYFGLGWFLRICLALLLIAEAARGSHGFPHLPTEKNLARGSPYAYAPEPNYGLIRDPSDHAKLTDGRHASGRFWTDRRATVGWHDSGPIRIEVDLGGGAAVDSVCVTSAQGEKADVYFPDRVDLFIRKNNDLYRYLGDLMTAVEPDDGGYRVRRFCSGPLQDAGRAVLLVVRPRGHFAFLDEVEISGKRTETLPHEGREKGIRSAEIAAFLDERYKNAPGRKSLRVLAEDVKMTFAGATAECSGLERVKTALANEGDLLQGDDLQAMQEGLLAVRQGWLAKQYMEPLLVWVTNPWEVFTPLSLPPSPQKSMGRKIEMDLPSGGTSSTAIGLTNTTARPMTVKVSHDGGRAGWDVTIREVAQVVSRDYRIIGDPLVGLKRGGISIHPGQSRQLWVTMDARSCPAGVYAARIIVTGDSVGITIPITMRVWNVSLTGEASLAVNAWSYLNWRPIRNLPNQAISDLEAHHVNVFVIHPSQIPWPNDGTRSGTVGPDYSAFDNVIKLYRKGSKFLFYFGWDDHPSRYKRIAPFPFLGEEWKSGFARWVTEWVAHLETLGIREDDFAFYPYDEPGGDRDVLDLVEIAKLLKGINPRLQVYTTLSVVPGISSTPLFEHVDIVQVYEPILPSIMKAIGPSRKIQVWSYSAGGGGKGADPHSFYRLQAWRAFRHGVTGIGFWAYADTGTYGTAWDDFDGTRPDYAVIYEGEEGIVSSKRWEAWREGAEDYGLLAKVQKKLKPGREMREFQHRVERVTDYPADFQYFQETRRLFLEIASR